MAATTLTITLNNVPNVSNTVSRTIKVSFSQDVENIKLSGGIFTTDLSGGAVWVPLSSIGKITAT